MTVTKTLTTTWLWHFQSLYLVQKNHDPAKSLSWFLVCQFTNLNTEGGDSEEPGSQREVAPEGEDQDGRRDEQEQTDGQGLKNIQYLIVDSPILWLCVIME